MRIKLDYFKSTGSWYGSSELDVRRIGDGDNGEWSLGIMAIVNMKRDRLLPGLIPDHSDFTVLATSDGGYRHLFEGAEFSGIRGELQVAMRRDAWSMFCDLWRSIYAHWETYGVPPHYRKTADYLARGGFMGEAMRNRQECE